MRPQYQAALDILKNFDLDLEGLQLVSKILNRNCDDDISDDVEEALLRVCKAIWTLENREYSPEQQIYQREYLSARDQ